MFVSTTEKNKAGKRLRVLRACLCWSVLNIVFREELTKILTFLYGSQGDGEQAIQTFEESRSRLCEYCLI